MEQIGGRRDGVGGEEDIHLGSLGAGDQPPGESRGAGDVAIDPGRHLRLGNPIDMNTRRQFRRLTISVAGVKGGDIGIRQLRITGELGFEALDSGLAVPLEQPHHQPQGPHILTAQPRLMPQVKLLHRRQHLLGNIDIQHPIPGQRPVIQRILGVFGLAEVLLGERPPVNDNQPPLHQIGQIGDQRRRIHSHQHIHRIPRRGDVVCPEINLKRRHPESGPRRRPNLRRKIRKSGKVVAVQGGGKRKTPPGKLHTVA